MELFWRNGICPSCALQRYSRSGALSVASQFFVFFVFFPPRAREVGADIDRPHYFIFPNLVWSIQPFSTIPRDGIIFSPLGPITAARTFPSTSRLPLPFPLASTHFDRTLFAFHPLVSNGLPTAAGRSGSPDVAWHAGTARRSTRGLSRRGTDSGSAPPRHSSWTEVHPVAQRLAGGCAPVTRPFR